jgi:Protein of unknown function (DUF3592)
VNQYKLPKFIVIIFGIIGPMFMAYAAYDIGKNSRYHWRLAEALNADGVETSGIVAALGPCKGSGRQPLDCWFSYNFQADGRTFNRNEVRLRYSEHRNYKVGQRIRVIHSARSPQQSTHRSVAEHDSYAQSNFLAAMGCILFIVTLLFVVTRQLIGQRNTSALAVSATVLYLLWFAGILSAS